MNILAKNEDKNRQYTFEHIINNRWSKYGNLL
jgi:hypothetical protein